MKPVAISEKTGRARIRRDTPASESGWKGASHAEKNGVAKDCGSAGGSRAAASRTGQRVALASKFGSDPAASGRRDRGARLFTGISRQFASASSGPCMMTACSHRHILWDFLYIRWQKPAPGKTHAISASRSITWSIL